MRSGTDVFWMPGIIYRPIVSGRTTGAPGLGRPVPTPDHPPSIILMWEGGGVSHDHVDGGDLRTITGGRVVT